MDSDVSFSGAAAPGFDVRCVFQPIVSLDSGQVVAYEALARGPAGGSLEGPQALFGAARAQGRLVELDWQCRTAALLGALAGGLAAPLTLFVNVEPTTLGVAEPAALTELVRQVGSSLPLMLEVTERELAARPAELLAGVAAAREQGWAVALDDVGAQEASLALMPFLRPDVIKLDLRLVQQRTTLAVAEIVSAVRAQAERTGALVLAEGIETAEHEALAIALGAQYGQGYRYGHPLPLPAQPRPVDGGLPLLRHRASGTTPTPTLTPTPWSLVAGSPQVRRAPKSLMMAIARNFERQALTMGASAVLLATFQQAEHFTPTTAQRYTALAERSALVGVLAQDMPDLPTPGMRGSALDATDPLTEEWDVLVVGPHYAGALLSRDLGDDGPDADRRFDYCVTHDRDLVLAASTCVLERVSGPAPCDHPTSPHHHLLASAAAGTDADLGGLLAGPQPFSAMMTPLATSRLEAGAWQVWTQQRPGLLSRAVEASPYGVTITSADGDQPLLYVNPAFERLSGRPAADLLGVNCRLLQGPDTDPAAVAALSEATRTGVQAQVTLLNYRADGSSWWNELFLAPVRDAAGAVTHYIGIQADVSDRVHADRQVQHLAHHDPLTGLANRTLLQQHLKQEIERAQSTGTSVALLYLDLNDFKSVNDALGHQAGDQLLLAVADRLRSVVRTGDLLARHGGDEFLLVAAGIRTRPELAAQHLADTLTRALTRPLPIDDHDVAITVSIGIALYPQLADDADALLAHADRAMYQAKNNRRTKRT